MKKLTALLLAVVMVMSMAACSGTSSAPAPTAAPTAAPTEAPAPTEEPAQEPAEAPIKEAIGVTIPAFALNVNGVKVTDAEMAAYAVYEVQTTTVNSSGTESTNTFVGFALSDVLAVAGVSEYKTIAAVADDGYTVEVDADTAALPDTLVAITRDGNQFKSSPWFAPCSSGTTGDYLKGMVAITVDGTEVKPMEAAEEAAEPAEAALPEISDKTDKVQFADYSFTVNGAEVTNATLEGLHIYKISVTTINKKGEEVNATYTGYKLADVLAACGITGAAKVTAVANDGRVSELAADAIESDYTLVAIEKDKEVGADGTIWLAPCASTTQSDYTKLVVEITAE